MAQELADSSHLLAKKALHRTDAARSARAYARILFAEVAVRIVAYVCDMIAVLFAMIVVDDHVFAPLGLSDQLATPVWTAVLIAYFVVSWTSPLRATPFQFLFGMRVLHEAGRPLSLKEAAIRSVALVALWGLTLFLLREFFLPEMWLRVAAVAVLLYVPSVTARRQGLHDLVARSIVVNRRALPSSDDGRRMNEFLADRGQETSKAARPSLASMAKDAVVLAVPIILMTNAVEISHQKNMHGRIAYAMGETYELQQLARNWYLATGDWPRDASELGRPPRHRYPDGGYFELEKGGVIRIQFDIVPELKHGSLLFEPHVRDDKITWQCRTVGDIERRYVPGICRD